MEERWYCASCGGEFARPAGVRDDGITVRLPGRCPRCGGPRIRRLARCPTCDGGWRRPEEKVCEKCHLHNLGELRLFARRFAPAALADLDDLLEGSGLETFT